MRHTGRRRTAEGENDAMDEQLVRAFRWAARGVGSALDYIGLRTGVGTLTGGLRNAVGRKPR
ncbi:hypothetical protein ACWFRT_08625 [Streptomyces anulatus]